MVAKIPTDRVLSDTLKTIFIPPPHPKGVLFSSLSPKAKSLSISYVLFRNLPRDLPHSRAIMISLCLLATILPFAHSRNIEFRRLVFRQRVR